MARRAKAPAAPPPVPLRVNDLLFLNEYFRNGQNATQAYLTVHPTVKYGSAEVLAHRLLGKVRVQEEIARRTRYDGGITKEWGQARLLNYITMAEAKGDYIAGASICMDAMKLAGFITDKREVKTIDAQADAVVTDILRRCRPTPPSPGPEASTTAGRALDDSTQAN